MKGLILFSFVSHWIYKLLLIQSKLFTLDAEARRMFLMGCLIFLSNLVFYGILLFQGILLQVDAVALSDDPYKRK